MKSKPIPAFDADDVDRFWRFVEFTDQCWLWTGVTKGEYGRFRLNDRMVSAHRFSYVMSNGEPPEGMDLDHLCRTRGCVRPTHLEPVTHQENVLRGEGMAARWARRSTCPEGHPFDGENPNGGRACSICTRKKASDRQRARRQRQKVAA